VLGRLIATDERADIVVVGHGCLEHVSSRRPVVHRYLKSAVSRVQIRQSPIERSPPGADDIKGQGRLRTRTKICGAPA
jgi:hypothetical protein